MFNPYVDALLDVPVADLFVDDDADSRLGHVVDDASFAVVDFVGHSTLQKGIRTWSGNCNGP